MPPRQLLFQELRYVGFGVFCFAFLQWRQTEPSPPPPALCLSSKMESAIYSWDSPSVAYSQMCAWIYMGRCPQPRTHGVQQIIAAGSVPILHLAVPFCSWLQKWSLCSGQAENSDPSSLHQGLLPYAKTHAKQAYALTGCGALLRRQVAHSFTEGLELLLPAHTGQASLEGCAGAKAVGC